MTSILITGGAGFIGSYFVKAMLDYHVVVLDKLTYASDLNRLDDVMQQISFVEGDICNQALVNSLFKKYQFKYVINFAAESHVDRSIEDARSFLETNVYGVQVLMDACLSQLKEDYLFVQISTDEVYGPSDKALDVNAPLRPQNPYAASKAAAELLINAYENTHGLKSMITRCNNNYGLYQHEEKFIPKVCSCIVNQEEIPVYGHGLQRRSWLHVKDHVRIIKQAILKDDNEACINISANENLSNLELVQKIISCFKSLGFEYKNHIRHVEDRKGHDSNYSILDNSLDHNRIGLDQGLLEIVRSYIERR